MSEGNQARNRTQPAPPAANTPPAPPAVPDPPVETPELATLQADFERLSVNSAAEAAELRTQLADAITERDAAIDERDASLQLRDAARADAQTLRSQLAEARADADALTAELTELRTTRSRRGGAVSSVITRTPSKEAKAKPDKDDD